MNGHAWQFFTSTESAWAELLSACKRATESIDLEQFVFGSLGPIEREFTDVLCAQARKGVRVRLLLDVVGSFTFYRSALCQELLSSGVKISFHMVLFPKSLKRLFPLVLRDHRKLLVIDGKEAHIGGVIIEERARSWRDSQVRLAGPVADDLRIAFDQAWEHTEKMRPMGRVRSQKVHAGFSVAGNSFYLRDRDLYRAFLRAITGAKQSILITTPYFFPNHEFMRALYYARKKGVEVKLLLPKISDNRTADFLASFYYKTLRRRGIRIFLYTKSILHAKTIVVDDQWASIGSCNFDWLSFWFNYELNVISTNQGFVSELASHFREDLGFTEEMK